MRQNSLFDDKRTSLDSSIEQSLASLAAYGEKYNHWTIAYSGGKDSAATVIFVAWAVQSGLIPAPASLTVMYADTRMELPPLRDGATVLLDQLAANGIQTKIVLPKLDDRYFVYMLGRGVPPPSNTFRWCTPQIKIEPMHLALGQLRQDAGEKLLMLTGVRLGESAARDQRIAISCSKDSGECGQGWFQVSTPDSLADTLSPLLHWRLCHVYDWLYFEQDRHGYQADSIAVIYGEDDVRTGCVGCPLASRDTALERLLATHTEYSRYAPLLELKPLYRDLKLPAWRKRKIEPEMRQDGQWSRNVQRMGPLTMEGRAYGLDTILDIQRRAGIDLINAEEETRIRQMWEQDIWPRKWSAADADATDPHPAIMISDDGNLIHQPLLV